MIRVLLQDVDVLDAPRERSSVVRHVKAATQIKTLPYLNFRDGGTTWCAVVLLDTKQMGWCVAEVDGRLTMK